jgi:hypothetical protein
MACRRCPRATSCARSRPVRFRRASGLRQLVADDWCDRPTRGAGSTRKRDPIGGRPLLMPPNASACSQKGHVHVTVNSTSNVNIVGLTPREWEGLVTPPGRFDHETHQRHETDPTCASVNAAPVGAPASRRSENGLAVGAGLPREPSTIFVRKSDSPQRGTKTHKNGLQAGAPAKPARSSTHLRRRALPSPTGSA